MLSPKMSHLSKNSSLGCKTTKLIIPILFYTFDEIIRFQIMKYTKIRDLFLGSIYGNKEYETEKALRNL